jgi:hypothetical protein
MAPMIRVIVRQDEIGHSRAVSADRWGMLGLLTDQRGAIMDASEHGP